MKDENATWLEEKKKLLMQIRSQKNQATKLSKRFARLTETVAQQQKLLNQYESALLEYQIPVKPQTKKNELTVDSPLCHKHPQKQPLNQWLTTKQPQPHSHKNTTKKSMDSFLLDDVRKNKIETIKMAKLKAFTPVDSGQKKDIGTSAMKKRRKENGSAYQYVEVVRKKDTRESLPGHDCQECKKYFEAVQEALPPSANTSSIYKDHQHHHQHANKHGTADQSRDQDHKDFCSRHRATFPPYSTPDDFWRLSFPDSQSVAR